jgi:hypothetical protein
VQIQWHSCFSTSIVLLDLRTPVHIVVDAHSLKS